MSKLANLIRRAAQIEPTTLGFSAGPKQAQPTMLLVGVASDHWERAAAESSGADVLLFAGRPREQETAAAARALGDRPA
jgi:hypothetical protein